MNDKLRQLLARRHRLFWKIVLLFWATLFATIVLNIAITQQIVEIEAEKRFSDSQIESLTQDAITILESGGNKSFIRWARKQRRESGIHIVLKNEYGQLLFEKFQPPENHSGHAPLPPPISRYVEGDDNRRYQVELHFTREASRDMRKAHPFHWLRWIATFLIIAFASWILSRHLGRPIAALSSASKEFAQGNLQARVSPKITSRKDEFGQLASDFDNMAEEIESLLNQQRQLLRDISHEIRTPLTRQRLQLELARRKGADDDFIALIERQNEKIDQLLSELLSMESMVNPRADQSQIDLYQLAREVVAQASIEGEAKSVQLALLSSLPDELKASLIVVGNTALIERAIENVLRNAIRHAPEYSVVTITLSVDQSNQANICIEDNGPGVSAEHIEKIFNPFFRDDKARSDAAGGVGLGLSIARKAAQLHHGSISASNRPAGGLQVVIRLPLRHSS